MIWCQSSQLFELHSPWAAQCFLLQSLQYLDHPSLNLAFNLLHLLASLKFLVLALPVHLPGR